MFARSFDSLGKCFAALALLSTLTVHAQNADKQTVVGIANFGPHPALDQTIAGFKEQMRKQGYVEGKNTTYVYSDANFTPALIPQILNQIESRKPALILTITTPVSQAAKSAISDKNLPVVFVQVSDPVAAGLVPDWSHGSARMVGSASSMDYDAVVAFTKQAFPNAKSFGLLYNPGEVNDVVAVKAIDAAAKRAGLILKAVSVDAPSDVPQRMQSLSDVDFFYAIASNLVQSSMPAVASVTDRYRIPILSAETELIKKGVVAASYTASYQVQGAHAAKLAAELLRGARPNQLAPVKPGKEDYTAQFSRKKFKQLGKTIPAEFADCNCFVD
jgi:putative ABC transport system substrate-binding protein